MRIKKFYIMWLVVKVWIKMVDLVEGEGIMFFFLWWKYFFCCYDVKNLILIVLLFCGVLV